MSEIPSWAATPSGYSGDGEEGFGFGFYGDGHGDGAGEVDLYGYGYGYVDGCGHGSLSNEDVINGSNP